MVEFGEVELYYSVLSFSLFFWVLLSSVGQVWSARRDFHCDLRYDRTSRHSGQCGTI